MAKSKTASRGKKTKDESKIDDAAKLESPPVTNSKIDVASDHLPPIFLVFTVMACSGFLFVYAFRDVFATGRIVGGVYDNAYLVRLYLFLSLLRLYSS